MTHDDIVRRLASLSEEAEALRGRLAGDRSDVHARARTQDERLKVIEAQIGELVKRVRVLEWPGTIRMTETPVVSLPPEVEALQKADAEILRRLAELEDKAEKGGAFSWLSSGRRLGARIDELEVLAKGFAESIESIEKSVFPLGRSAMEEAAGSKVYSDWLTAARGFRMFGVAAERLSRTDLLAVIGYLIREKERPSFSSPLRDSEYRW